MYIHFDGNALTNGTRNLELNDDDIAMLRSLRKGAQIRGWLIRARYLKGDFRGWTDKKVRFLPFA